jgi:hypothetical protein
MIEGYLDRVDVATQFAKGIAFDTCHKIYVLMDDQQMEEMESYGYDPLIPSSAMTPDQMKETLRQWWLSSCGLRFIQAVRTNTADPNAGFVDLIPQGTEYVEGWDEYEEGDDE